MANFIDYLNWRGDLSFSRDAYNRVDLSIISQLSIIDLLDLVPAYPKDKTKEVALKDVSRKYFRLGSNKSNKIGLIIPSTILGLLKECASTKRFGKLKMSNYFDIIDESGEEQISAFTIKLTDKIRVISFSGTDDTIIGWKENLNMICKSPIPAQVTAVKYINDMLALYDEDFIICGHSKGGNMSIYGGVHADETYQKRILRIYNFDGPGVCKAVTHEKCYMKYLNKVITTLPQSSTIGRLFEHKETCEIIKSNEVGLLQHDAFSWDIMGTDFIKEKEATKESQAVDIKIKEILDEMNEEEKHSFVEGIYRILTDGDAKSLLDLKTRRIEITKAYFKLSKEDKKAVMGPIKKLISNKNCFAFFFDTIKEYRTYMKTTAKDDII